MPTKKELSAAAAIMGKKGGKQSSREKTAAVRRNAQQPRPNRRKSQKSVSTPGQIFRKAAKAAAFARSRK